MPTEHVQDAKRTTGTAATVADDASHPVRSTPMSFRPVPVAGLVSRQPVLVGSANDPLEREADLAADRAIDVLRRRGNRPAEPPPTPPADSLPRRLRRSGLPADEVVGARGGALPDSAAATLSAVQPGRPLPDTHRRMMEGAFRADFSDVRVHTGPDVEQIGRRIQARAFTVDRDVHFPDGLPEITSERGRHLLAHELAHTLQAPGRGHGPTAARQIRRLLDLSTLTQPQRQGLVAAYRADNLASAMWGRESDLLPIAHALNIQINVVDYAAGAGADANTAQMQTYGAGRAIYLRYTGDHYNVLVPDPKGRFSYTPAVGQRLKFRSIPVPGNGNCLYVSIWRAAQQEVVSLAALVNPGAAAPGSDDAGQAFLRDLAHGGGGVVDSADILSEIAAMSAPLEDEHIGPQLTAAIRAAIPLGGPARKGVSGVKSGKDRQALSVRFAEDSALATVMGSTAVTGSASSSGASSGPAKQKVLGPDEVKKRLAGFKNAPAYWAGLDWVAVDANLMKAEIRAGHPEFDRIAEAVSAGLAGSPYTSPAGESTRMEVMQKACDDLAAKKGRSKDEDDKLRIIRRRLREGKSGGAAAPRSRPVEIDRIEVIANQVLWSSYQAAAQSIRTDLRDKKNRNPLRKVAFSGHRTQKLDPKGADPAGEVNLFHGTSPAVMDILEKSGFDPRFSANKAKPGAKTARYGPLGQGVYLADVMSKAMTYARCPVCGDYDCQDHKDEIYQMLYSRVALGRTKKAHAMLQPGDLRADDLSTLKEGRHSVYSKGFAASGYNAFDAASGQNEYVVKEAAQTYPEFRIYYRVRNPKKNA